MPFGIRSIVTKSPLGIKAAKTFVERARAAHGTAYDYSRVDYAGANSKVEIICPTHGVFLQTPSMHINDKNGCQDCYNERRKERGRGWANAAGKAFVSRARAVHGDKYDYSRVHYVRNQVPVEIICPIHGVFSQVPTSHLHGSGCNLCKHDAHRFNMSKKAAAAASAFVQKARAVHGDSYDYAEVEYSRTGTPITITCMIHGDFQQTPNKHLGGQGCPACGDSSRQLFHDKRTQTARESFVERARQAHGDKYDYSEAKYVDAKSKVSIRCPVHGLFRQVADTHISGKGCVKCRDDANKAMQQELSRQVGLKFPARASKIHGGKYDYSEVDYKGKDAPIAIICPIHGRFFQAAGKHLQGNGCQQCAIELNLGEEIVAKVLHSHGVTFERQYSPEWGKGKRTTHRRSGVIYDFALHELKILIERDGEQHYFPVRFGGMEHARAQRSFEKQVTQDLHKTNLAKNHGWRVCRIPYFCDDVAGEVLNILSGKPTYPEIPDVAQPSDSSE